MPGVLCTMRAAAFLAKHQLLQGTQAVDTSLDHDIFVRSSSRQPW